MRPAKTDRAKGAVPVGEGEAMGLSVDQPPGAIADLAVVGAVILDESEDFEIGGAGERHTMLGDVGFVFRRVELDQHECIYDMPDVVSIRLYIQ